MKKKTKIILIILAILFVCAGAFLVWMLFFQKTTSEDVLEMIVEDNPDAVISVGIWDDGKEELYLYTKDGKQDFVKYKYQIGSVTKTFTGAMLAKQVYDEKMSLDDHIDKFLPINDTAYNPELRKLITHKSGLSTEWEDVLAESDDIFSVKFTREDMVNVLNESKLEDKQYDFEYSNYGSALVGTATANYIDENKTYQDIMNDFINNELELTETKVGGNGNFTYNYKWNDGDEMLGDGAIVSTVPDLLKYGRMYLSDDEKYNFLDLASTPLDNKDKDYDIGFFWMVDKESGMVWHNGEVAFDGPDGDEVGYMSFIGIDKNKNKVVVVLYNGISNYDDTAMTDLLGYLLMEED